MPIKSKSQWKWMQINDPKMFKKWQKEHPVDYNSLPDKVEEESDKDKPLNLNNEIGLIDRKNLNDLLMDEELHSYFAIPENFDRFVKDVNGFFTQKDLSPTINAVTEYLTNLNYGEKTIQKAIDILSMTDEERAAKNDKEKETQDAAIGVTKKESTFNKNFVKGEVSVASKKKKKESKVDSYEIIKWIDKKIGDLSRKEVLEAKEVIINGIVQDFDISKDKAEAIYDFHFDLKEKIFKRKIGQVKEEILIAKKYYLDSYPEVLEVLKKMKPDVYDTDVEYQFSFPFIPHDILNLLNSTIGRNNYRIIESKVKESYMDQIMSWLQRVTNSFSKETLLQMKDKFIDGISADFSLSKEGAEKVFNYYLQLRESKFDIKEDLKFGDQVRINKRNSPYYNSKGVYIHDDSQNSAVVELPDGSRLVISKEYLLLESKHIDEVGPTNWYAKQRAKGKTPKEIEDVWNDLPKEEKDKLEKEDIKFEEDIRNLKNLGISINRTNKPEDLLKIYEQLEKEFLLK